MIPAFTEQPGNALMETQGALNTVVICATHSMNLLPGLRLTMAQKSLSKGSRFSTEYIAVEIVQKMLISAFQTSFQLLAARCFLVAHSLDIFLDLQLMGNT